MSKKPLSQIYLTVALPEEAGALAVCFNALLRLLDHPLAKERIAAVLIGGATGGAPDARAVPVIEAVQKRGIAAVVAEDARLARTLRADGVHLPVSEPARDAYAATRDMLGSRYIVGADAGFSRHDAMELGEAGAEYIGFSLPDDVVREDALARQLDLVQWWSEIFEVPCVALDLETADELRAALTAGADFAAIRMPPDLAPADLSAWLETVAGAIAAA